MRDNNPDSRWILLHDEAHGSVMEHLTKYLNYVMQFRRDGERIDR